MQAPGAGPGGGNLDAVYTYDANGNVGQLVAWAPELTTPPGELSAGRLLAPYEYDPYGGVTGQAGTSAAANPVRFSAKYWDNETGPGYWGYRYHNPDLGRWISRDPIGEEGGLNLYGFVRNDSINKHDPKGHEVCGTIKCKCPAAIGGGTAMASVYSSSRKTIALPSTIFVLGSCKQVRDKEYQPSDSRRKMKPMLQHECMHKCQAKRDGLVFLLGIVHEHIRCGLLHGKDFNAIWRCNWWEKEADRYDGIEGPNTNQCQDRNPSECAPRYESDKTWGGTARQADTVPWPWLCRERRRRPGSEKE